jgi:hypothetical protein
MKMHNLLEEKIKKNNKDNQQEGEKRKEYSKQSEES